MVLLFKGPYRSPDWLALAKGAAGKKRIHGLLVESAMIKNAERKKKNPASEDQGPPSDAKLHMTKEIIDGREYVRNFEGGNRKDEGLVRANMVELVKSVKHVALHALAKGWIPAKETKKYDVVGELRDIYLKSDDFGKRSVEIRRAANQLFLDEKFISKIFEHALHKHKMGMKF